MGTAHRVQIKTIFILIIFFLSSYLNVFAGVTGKIAGVVTDVETGEPLVGANVLIKAVIKDGEIKETGSDLMLGASTDAEGAYFIINVPPGIYVVEALYIGYGPVQKSQVQVFSE